MVLNRSSLINRFRSVLGGMSTSDTTTWTIAPPASASFSRPWAYRNTPAVATVARINAKTTTSALPFTMNHPPCCVVAQSFRPSHGRDLVVEPDFGFLFGRASVDQPDLHGTTRVQRIVGSGRLQVDAEHAAATSGVAAVL